MANTVSFCTMLSNKASPKRGEAGGQVSVMHAHKQQWGGASPWVTDPG